MKTNTAFELPPPSSVTVPVIAKELPTVYTPGVMVVPPISAETEPVAVNAFNDANADCAATLALFAVASVMCCVPKTTPGGKPVTEVPG